jgi:hypothetical protein
LNQIESAGNRPLIGRNKMRLFWQIFAAAAVFSATPSAAEPSARPIILVSNETRSPEPDADLFALMSGSCSTLKIAGGDFKCKAVAFVHSQQGRTNFTIALDDPADDSHVISFSGEKGQRKDNLYELPVDRMLLSSKDRPRVDGLPVPAVELTAGICRQLGDFAAGQVSSISCIATDKSGKSYELQFESDGLPITVRRIRLSTPTIRQHPNAELGLTQQLVEPNAVPPEYREAGEKRRAAQFTQLECRQRAAAAKVLPRDRTAYIVQCLTEFNEKPATTAHQ